MFIKQKITHCISLLSLSFLVLVLAACQSSTEKDPAVDQLRQSLTSLQSDSRLASLAEVAIGDAEKAVRAAELAESEGKEERTAHLVYIANNKIELARALASARYEENQLQLISEKRQQAKLNAASSRAQELEQELADLKQKETERGTVFTLGDALFETNKSDLKPGAQNNFRRLAEALKQRSGRTVVVEGHTDSQGSNDYNLALSQRRADAVKNYLINYGVDASRITSIGKGEEFPVATNDTASGRQQNRRVEVIIENAEN